MTVSSATAEKPRARPRRGTARGAHRRSVPDRDPALTRPPSPPKAAPTLVARTVVHSPPPERVAQGRAECLAARRQERRQRRQLAVLGLAVIAVTLAATVAVLDVLH